jgi:CRISPR-associated protein Cmr4
MYKTKRHVIMTMDPLHVGTGGYRLGLVDLSIVREPGTNCPKIPGTSLHGTIRSYAAYLYNKRTCAGPSLSEGIKRHCGQPSCPICYTFGYVKDISSGSEGVVNINDAQILFFPVYSMMGPVWVSTVPLVQEFGFQTDADSNSARTTMNLESTSINLGWLMVEVKKSTLTAKGIESPEWNTIKDRIVLVPESLFSQIVNSNLEIRTSVSISPETGAAEDGALFTHEAIPRSAILWFDVVEDDRGEFPKTERTYSNGKDNNGDSLSSVWNSPLDVVKAGLQLAQHLGVGGMGTRGFGRIRLLTWEVQE